MKLRALEAYGMKPITPLVPDVGIGQTKPLGQQPAKEQSFSSVLSEAISEVDTMQKSADQKIESWVTGKGEITTHDAMLALEKADVSFQLMNAVRGKLIRAYEEIMRTQV